MSTGAPPDAVPAPPDSLDPRAHGSDDGAAERLRRATAVPVAFLASALAVACVPNAVGLVPDLVLIAAADERFGGWAGLGVLAGTAAAALALATMQRTGAGPALSLGAAAAVFGLTLGHQVGDAVQVRLAFLLLGLAVGGLLTGAAGMAFELTGRLRSAVLLVWVIPLVSGWPVVAWVALHDAAGDTAQFAVHPPAWLLLPIVVTVVAWSALSMLVEAPRARFGAGPFALTPWTALLAVFGVAALVSMVIGFGDDIDVAWLRPLVIAFCGALVVVLGALASAVQVVAARAGYLALLVVALCYPASIQTLVAVTDAGDVRVTGPALAVLAASAVVGVVAGWWRPMTACWLGLLGVAAAASGAWVIPDTPWPMVAAAAPLAAAAGAAAAAGVRLSTVSPLALRFAVLTVAGVVLLGVVLSVALGWALGGELAATTDDARAAGRVVLGLTVAASVLVSGYLATLVPRLPQRR